MTQEIKVYRVMLNKIHLLTATKETQHCFFINRSGARKPERWNKKSTRYAFFHSFDEAKQYLIQKLGRRLESCRHSLQSAQSAYGNAKGYRECDVREIE